MGKWDWLKEHETTRQESTPDVISASYSLQRLLEAGLISRQRSMDFLEQAGLADFSWRIFWSKSVVKYRRYWEGMRQAQGFVIFIHGWDGTHAIWEQIPAAVCAANPRLVALAPDVNGFGHSPFVTDFPALDQCDPSANMRTIESWIDLLGLRSSQRATRRWRVITLVGHSMGGATLFYLNEARYRPHEVARVAVAPALLTKDTLRKGFYKALGVGIWAGSTSDTLSWLKSALAPSIVEALIGDASQAVKEVHTQVFNATPPGVLAQTFFAMGSIPTPVKPRRWHDFQVLLGHKDRLVGVKPMLDLLEELGLASDQLRVLLGDHYLFSVSRESWRLHQINRDLLVEQILSSHEACRREQRG